MIIGVKRWAIVATFIVAVCSGVGVTVGTWRSSPDVPPPCHDEMGLRNEPANIKCDSQEAVLSVDKPTAGTMWLFRCVCPRGVAK